MVTKDDVMVTRDDADLTTFVAKGEMSAEDVFTAFSHFLDAGPTRLTLWDLSSADLGVDKESVKILASRVALAARGRRPPGKTAVVCGRPVDFGKVHLLAAYLSIEGYPVDVATFTEIDAAKAWLGLGRGVPV
jgi:hypothetical protein